MTTQPIKILFASDIGRKIEEVIKVDQTDDEVLRAEIDEYVVTDAIRAHYTGIFEAYAETPNKPHEGIAVWVSGFFGSGKSSFAKMLGLSISNRPIGGPEAHPVAAGERFAERAGDNKLHVLLTTISEKIPTHAVIFDVSTDRGIRSGNQTLTEIMYGLFLQSLGYAKDLDLSELEIVLEEKGELALFETEYMRIYEKDWSAEKGKVAFALSEASRVMHSLNPTTYPMADSWVKAVKNKADISPGKLAERANELMKRRRPGQSLIFVVDEVGQFVARDVQKMLDLQAIVQSLGVKGRGKHWIVVTSQESLAQLVSGLDDKKIELRRLMDRFPLQVHLEPSDISEVTSRRVLSKNAAAQATLGALYDENYARLAECTRLTADIRLPELTRDGFIDLYPLLPYQIDLIIKVVSGLRTQGGASKHVGGANRTIIKLAQQLLINQAVNLAEKPVGALVTLDDVYDLVEGNISSEIRAKIAAISKEVLHPFAQRVAKVICLLQYVESVHCTAENIAAALHGGVAVESQLPEVKDALRALEAAHMVRLGDQGYRIPSPAEDDWERIRNATSPRPGDAHRLQAELLATLWQPQPLHMLFDTRAFRAGLSLRGRIETPGDLVFHIYPAEDEPSFKTLAADLRSRSQQERTSVFWAVAMNDAIDSETVQLFRSREMIERKGRDARTGTENRFIGEEKRRLGRHQDELKRLLRIAWLSGAVYFRGNDRSPDDRATDVGKAAADILGHVLPEVFDRFKEAAAKTSDLKRGLDALLAAENLHGLPPVFAALDLLRDEAGKPVFRVESGPLAEVLRRIGERANYGDQAGGRFLTDELGKEPFGWDFEAVRLLVLCLLRAGKIDATSKGQTIDSATSVNAKEAFSNNNVFKQASFRPKKGIEFAELVKAARAFQETFGAEVKELSATSISAELRHQVGAKEDAVAAARTMLIEHRLPGVPMLEKAIGQMKAILRSSEDGAIGIFNTSFRSIKEAIKRAAELEGALTETRLLDLERARRAVKESWPILQQEPDVPAEIQSKVVTLEDLLEREMFFRELPAIDQHARAVEAEYEKRYTEALDVRIARCTAAHDALTKTPGWANLDENQRRQIALPLARGMAAGANRLPIPQLRSEAEACESRLKTAISEVHRIVEGGRLATVMLGGYFAGGIETEDQLDAALLKIRDECSVLIAAGKKIVVQ